MSEQTSKTPYPAWMGKMTDRQRDLVKWSREYERNPFGDEGHNAKLTIALMAAELDKLTHPDIVFGIHKPSGQRVGILISRPYNDETPVTYPAQYLEGDLAGINIKVQLNDVEFNDIVVTTKDYIQRLEDQASLVAKIREWVATHQVYRNFLSGLASMDIEEWDELQRLIDMPTGPIERPNREA